MLSARETRIGSLAILKLEARHNRGYPTADPLKPAGPRADAAIHQYNRGYPTADPLKQYSFPRARREVRHNRGYPTADPLKPSAAER